MSIRPLPLDGLTSKYATLEADEAVGYNVFHVKKPFVLVQAAGYLKHNRAQEKKKAVYFRGQNKLYSTLQPTLYRKMIKMRGREKRDVAILGFLEKIRKDKSILRAVDPWVQEPLLQHYGLKTRWLDVIDNVWIALWFACHTAHPFGKHGEFLHFEKRIVRHTIPAERYAYILLLESATTPDANAGPGCYIDSNSATIDLRVAAPSQFIRPHAQHGLCLQALSGHGKPKTDFSELLCGIIRVDLEDALEWLGNGDLLSVHALFPPPPYDFGFQELLKNYPEPSNIIGAIHNIGAGK